VSVAAIGRAAPAAADESLVYIGTYTGGVSPEERSAGIYVARFRADTGEVTVPAVAAETDNPSFLAVHPSRRFLYAANESGERSGVSAFAIDPASGKLTLLNRVSPGGNSPCHISIDRAGKNLLVANFSGSVAVLRIRDDGSLGERTALVTHSGSGPNRQWQSGPHVHWAGFSPDNRFALAVNIGNDQVFVYGFDAERGTLSATPASVVKLKPGTGPRHIAFHPNGKFAYLINQLSGSLMSYRWDAARGALEEIRSVTTIPADYSGEINGGEVVLDAAGRYLYTSTRGSDSIAVFSIDPEKGTAVPLQQVPARGISPRHIALDPDGGYLLAANQHTDGVVVFRVDRPTGRLIRIVPARRAVRVNSPACVVFLGKENLP
jgi:6-phosphogluconolactonase